MVSEIPSSAIVLLDKYSFALIIFKHLIMNALTQRDIDILSLLISEYTATAMPVASARLAGVGTTGLSSATIRNILARLESLGLLTHPHTSAGRVPTTAGFRFYVNLILGRRVLSKEEKLSIEKQFSAEPLNIEEALKRAGKILSLVSNYTGIVVMPRPQNTTFKHMEFLPLSAGKLLGIFISREGAVHNRVIDIGEDYSYPDLEKISHYCNKIYYGCNLEDARQKAVKEFEEERARYDRLISKALLWSKELFDEAGVEEMLVEGETKFLSTPEFSDVDKLKQVLSALEEKKGIMHLLTKAAESDDVCVFIGAESKYEPVADCSIVTAGYKRGGAIAGMLGVIGPTRMDYSRVIPTVDFTAKLVSNMLEG